MIDEEYQHEDMKERAPKFRSHGNRNGEVALRNRALVENGVSCGLFELAIRGHSGFGLPGMLTSLGWAQKILVTSCPPLDSAHEF
jgi:hypothetical protein